jgi:hypothetical protein
MPRNSNTHKAIERQRAAAVAHRQAEQYEQEGRYPAVVVEAERKRAESLEREAERYLAPTQPVTVKHGELARPVDPNSDDKHYAIANTLDVSPTAIALDASMYRTDLLVGSHIDVLAMGIDAAESIQARNSIEKMLSHQMAAAHQASLQLVDKATGWLQKSNSNPSAPTEAARLMMASAKMMQAFQQGAMTLQRLRTGGQQTVTVQHVNVGAGGQAVIGNVQTGVPLVGDGDQT